MGLSRRHFITSTTLLGAAMLAGCTKQVSGQAAPNPDDLRRASESAAPKPGLDVVTVGIIPYEPYTEGTGADLKGPIPDVAKKVLTEMGAGEVKFVVMNEQAKVLAALLTGSIDVAGGLGIGSNYCRGAKFSEPDFVSGTAFAVPGGNPKGLRTYADVARTGAKVAVMPGAPEEKDAQAGGATSIVTIPDPARLLDAVRNGQVDCFAFDDISLRYMVKTNGQGLEVTPGFMPEHRLPFVGGYAFPQDTELLDDFNAKLKELHDSGEWLRIVQPFEFTKDNEPPADLTAEKACAG